MYLTGFESNLWKQFLIQFTNRRNFIPILSVYYLTIPDTFANEIGLYTGIGYIASFLFQIPSGFIADHWGQKNTLIIAKLLLLISSILYVIAGGFWIFTLAAVCMSLGQNAFSTGTTSSFLKGTLEKLGRGGEYRFVASRISGNVSFFSIFFIVFLPFLTEVSIKMPLYVGLILDIVGLIVAFSLIPVHTRIEKHEKKGIFTLIKELHGSGFFPYAFFAAVIGGFLFADNVYRSPYLVELGYPLTFIGFVMGGSRLVWWAVGRSIKTIENYISFQKLILIELFVFPLYYFGAGYITNPWLLGLIFSLTIGWFWGRSEVYTDYFIDRIPDTRYRATILSTKTQLENLVSMIISFGIADIMGISYQLGFQILGITLFFLLAGIFFFGIRKNQI